MAPTGPPFPPSLRQPKPNAPDKEMHPTAFVFHILNIHKDSQGNILNYPHLIIFYTCCVLELYLCAF